MILENKYINYIHRHQAGVLKSWKNILYPVLLTESDYDVELLTDIEILINCHDESKFKSDEFDAYCNYFYPSEENAKDEEAFNKAWFLHQRRNPHHWQYWCLIEDSGKIIPLDMPVKYICEMLCDWSSFQFVVDKNSTANNWYQKNKNKMVLSDSTRQTVEELLKIAPKL